MIIPSDGRVAEAVLRQDFLSFLRKTFHWLSPGQAFVPGWALEAIAWRLEQVRRGGIKRLIINMPPRSLKSMAASVAFPAFVLGHDPTKRIICVSYSSDLARKLSNDFRAVLGHPAYQRLFPRTRVGARKDTEAEVELTERGLRLATSVGGTLTGRGGDIIIIDDPLKPLDAQSEASRGAVNQWYANTLLSRLDDKRLGAIVIVMQRVHLDDLTGFVLSQSDDWTVLNLPAIAECAEIIPLGDGRVHCRRAGDVLSPEREPLLVLEDMRRQLGSDFFSAQYQQAPVPPGGAMIRRGWVRRYTVLPEADAGQVILQSWDTASKGGPDNDWSVCTTWRQTRDQQWYLLDVWRKRVDYPTLRTNVEEHARIWKAEQVLIEESGTAIGLIEELRFRVSGVIPIRPDQDKISRMSMTSATFEAGQVHLPERAPWLADFEAELFAFPGSRHDDQVDSVSQALLHGKRSSVWLRL
jgi:predicted phage terminase large subunit-like protein